MELYLIFKCGYEGIERVLFPTHDPKEAASKIIEIRNAIHSARQDREKFLEIHGKETDEHCLDAWDRHYFAIDEDGSISKEDKRIASDKFDYSKWQEPDAYCVQKWDEENKEFKCFCKELGVEPSKTWFM